MQKKAAEDMRADIQRKCLWSPRKKQQWVNSVWTLQLLDHENLQHRHCLIIPKENKGNSCSLQHNSWHTETQRKRVSERERTKEKERHCIRPLIARVTTHMIDCSLERLALSLPLLPDRSPSESQCFLACWKSYDWIYMICENSDEKTQGLSSPQ